MILERILNNLFTYLLLTIVLEGAAAYVLGVRDAYRQAVILLANAITNPLLNGILTVTSFYISPQSYYYLLVPLEVLVVIGEGTIYRKSMDLERNPYGFSLFLNLCSYFLGTALLHLLKMLGGM